MLCRRQVPLPGLLADWMYLCHVLKTAAHNLGKRPLFFRCHLFCTPEQFVRYLDLRFYHDGNLP